jgi:signal transduction histidine kinase
LSVTVVTLVVFGVPLAWVVGRVYRGEELRRLQQAATVAAAAVPGEGLGGTDPIEPPVVPSGVSLAYYDAHGILVAGNGPARPGAVASRARAGQPAEGTDGGRVVSAQPIVAGEATLGTVVASSSHAALTWRTWRAWLEMLALGGVALAAAALIALAHARRLARPVEDLIAAADELGDGQFALATTPSGVAEIDQALAAIVVTSGRLRDLVDRERAFTAHASHQLRTPLTAVRLSLENALLTPDVDVKAAVGDAVADVDRVEATLDELFQLARNDAPLTRRVPVADVLQALERRWHPQLAPRGRRLRVSGDGVGDRTVPATLAQILDILVDNAATHGRGTVDVAARGVAGGLRIGVEDEGDGIASLARPPSGDGHGLGLRLAQTLAEAAGGRLLLRRPGPGPIIDVILPIG